MLTYISNSAHYKEVLSRVLHVKESLWIGTADIKDLYIEDGKTNNVSSKRGQKELVLSAEREKGRATLKPFLEVLAKLIKKGVAVRLIHAKEPDGTRNFEAGILTDDPAIVAQAMDQFDEVWIGKHCKNCKRKDFCPDPILAK